MPACACLAHLKRSSYGRYTFMCTTMHFWFLLSATLQLTPVSEPTHVLTAVV